MSKSMELLLLKTVIILSSLLKVGMLGPSWYSGNRCALEVDWMGLNPTHDPKEGWASTWGNGSKMGVHSDRRSPLGGLL